MLTQLSASQHQRMQAYIATARNLTAAQRTLRRTEAGMAMLKQQIAGQKAALAKLITKQKSILATLTARQRAAARAASVGSGGTTTSTYTGPTTTQAQRAVAFAYAQLGKPYVWGATGPDSFDCSGLVMTAWASSGVSVPRDTYQQWAALPHVPMSSIQPGDLIFFDAVGHVAIYVGSNMIIDAPQPGQSVEKVSLSSSWYAANLDGAARP
jgi:cell wall-associated NlpC family hydrolase